MADKQFLAGRRALYQDQLDDNRVACLLCPHACVLQEGQTGLCRTRVNREGELMTLAYGNPCSVALDPIEKKPLYHFLPGTSVFSFSTGGCNFRCLNCQNWEISQVSPLECGRYQLKPEELVDQAILHGADSIAFTYTEPTVYYEYMFDTARLAHEKGLKTVMVSNGYIQEAPLQQLIPYLDAANIDLKCFDETIYRRLTGGKLRPVLQTLESLKSTHVWLEITNLLVPGFSDQPEQITSMCQWLIRHGFERTPLHFSRFFPMYKLNTLPPTSAALLVEAKTIAEKAGLKYVYIGNVRGLNAENTRCPSCGAVLIMREAYRVAVTGLEKDHCQHCGASLDGIFAE